MHRVTAQTDCGEIVVRTSLRLDGRTSAYDVVEKLRPIAHPAVAAAVRRWCFERSA